MTAAVVGYEGGPGGYVLVVELNRLIRAEADLDDSILRIAQSACCAAKLRQQVDELLWVLDIKGMARVRNDL